MLRIGCEQTSATPTWTKHGSHKNHVTQLQLEHRLAQLFLVYGSGSNLCLRMEHCCTMKQYLSDVSTTACSCQVYLGHVDQLPNERSRYWYSFTASGSEDP